MGGKGLEELSTNEALESKKKHSYSSHTFEMSIESRRVKKKRNVHFKQRKSHQPRHVHGHTRTPTHKKWGTAAMSPDSCLWTKDSNGFPPCHIQWHLKEPGKWAEMGTR